MSKVASEICVFFTYTSVPYGAVQLKPLNYLTFVSLALPLLAPLIDFSISSCFLYSIAVYIQLPNHVEDVFFVVVFLLAI